MTRGRSHLLRKMTGSWQEQDRKYSAAVLWRTESWPGLGLMTGSGWHFNFANDDIKIWLCLYVVSENVIGNIRILTRVSAFWRTQSCFENKIFNLFCLSWQFVQNISLTMTETRSPRKRKNSDETGCSKKVTNNYKGQCILLLFYMFLHLKVKVSCCFLCKEPLVAFDSGCPLKSKLLQSQHTFLEVLSKLFQKENLTSQSSNGKSWELSYFFTTKLKFQTA